MSCKCSSLDEKNQKSKGSFERSQFDAQGKLQGEDRSGQINEDIQHEPPSL